jgi:two-component system response regulator CpxR
MRPKRQVLLVDRDEVRLSLRRFLLSTRGYSVASASSIKGAIRKAASIQVDVVVAELDLGPEDGRDLVRLLNEGELHIPTILMSESILTGAITHPADVFLGKKECEAAGLLERVKIMSARKRGPKKAALRAPVKACA